MTTLIISIYILINLSPIFYTVKNSMTNLVTPEKIIFSVVKKGVLNGWDIQRNFYSSLNENHSMVWIYIQRVCTKVLGGDWDEEPEAIKWVKEMLSYFEIIDASMTLKLYFFHPLSKQKGFTKPNNDREKTVQRQNTRRIACRGMLVESQDHHVWWK